MVKVDVDKASGVSEECGIEAIATFNVYRDGVEVEMIQGADQAGLEALVAKYSRS